MKDATSVSVCALREAADEIARFRSRKELCDTMRKFQNLLEPLLSTHRIPMRPVVPPALRDTFDAELSSRVSMQAQKVCLADPPHMRAELLDLYDLFVELQEQYCVSTRELKRAA